MSYWLREMFPLRHMIWNCSLVNPENPERMNIAFRAGTSGLHSAEN